MIHSAFELGNNCLYRSTFLIRVVDPGWASPLTPPALPKKQGKETSLNKLFSLLAVQTDKNV